MPRDLIRLVAILAAGGYRIDIRRVLHASYHCTVLDDAGRVVGDLEYRSNLDERSRQARGLSYGASRQTDHALKIVQRFLRRSSTC